MIYPTGYRQDLERRHELQGSAILAFSRPASIPATVDPRSWLIAPNQLQTSSCVGNSTSNAAEMLYWVKTKGEVIQLSRWQAYLSAQREDNLVGSDNGATIAGTVAASEKRGLCLETLCPFPSSYHTKVSAEAWADAESRQILSHKEIGSFDEAVEWIGGGLGAVIIGVPVGQQFMNCDGLIDSVEQSGGGHALAIVGYVPSGSDKRLLLINSWGNGWGKSGWAEVTRRAFDGWCQQVRGGRSEIWGVADVEAPEPRDMDWLEYHNV